MKKGLTTLSDQTTVGISIIKECHRQTNRHSFKTFIKYVYTKNNSSEKELKVNFQNA
jgi:hypothetical protein